MSKINTYGIKTININGTIVNTYNVSVKNTLYNKELLEKEGINHEITNGKHSQKLKMTFTSTDVMEFTRQTYRLGKALENIALNNLTNKYSWYDRFKD
jgi:hypothetical protein